MDKTYYKSYRITNGKPGWIVIDEDYNKILSPTRDRLKTAKLGNPPKKCCKCGNTETYVHPDGYEHWYSHKCDKKNCTGYLCQTCWSAYDIENNPNNQNNMMRSMANVRNCQLDIYSTSGKGFIIEAIIAKERHIKIYNIEIDNFSARFDLYDQEYRRIQSKSPSLNEGLMRWDASFGMYHNFDALFLSCMDKDRKNIERLYIIPESELYGDVHLSIYMGSLKYPWYENFRVDEKTKDRYNNSYNDLASFIGNKRYFGIDEIKRWLDK